MPQSRVFNFSDPDAYQEKIRACNLALLTMSKGEFHAGIAHITLDRVWMQWGSDSLPRIARTTVDASRTIFMFPADSEQPAMRVGGRDVANDDLIVWGRGTTNVVRTEAGNRWASVSLDHDELMAAGTAIASREVVCPSDTQLVTPSPIVMTQLKAIHRRAVQLAKSAPEALLAPAAAAALEQQVKYAMVACLTCGTPSERQWLPGQHARIVNRFLEFLEAKPGEPVYIAEICAAIGASERTLRTCCQEILGTGPVRYLWLRRMHLARQALLHADASTASVTDIATAHGFWELGRFSVQFRGLFGESPSESLRRKIAM